MAQPLPVIVSFGGVNSAGRASMHHATSRLLYDILPEERKLATQASLRQLMGDATADEARILESTLIRRIEPQHFDPMNVSWNRRLPTLSGGKALSFDLPRRHLPTPPPVDWVLSESELDGHVHVQITGQQDFLLPDRREFDVKVASQLPTGFEPAELYPSRNHPRGLAMAIYAASDALGNLGLDWDALLAKLAPEQVSVYAGSAMGQLDDNGAGGMLSARYRGGRVTSKNCPLGLAQMPSDFINAYVLGTAGSTGATLGACASFLYNLRHAIHDIRSGRARIAVVGAAEAPVVPEVMDGYASMGALASDKALRQLDGLASDETPDYRRACRPFGENCGFTIGESAQAIVLFDDRLALETGATVFGSAADVFVNADGYKKSISGPGIGNYMTMARATACARAIVGDEALRRGGFVQAHGTGTPQNRVTESAILDRVAAAFDIQGWPIVGLKAHLGHSLGASSGDQVAATLGSWALGWLPGIVTTQSLADDVHADTVDFCLDHREVDLKDQAYALINAKGFGGNNATATLLSPNQTVSMLRARHGESAIDAWRGRGEAVESARDEREARVLAGGEAPRYRFDYGVLGDDAVSINADELQVGEHSVDLRLETPFGDMQG